MLKMYKKCSEFGKGEIEKLECNIFHGGNYALYDAILKDMSDRGEESFRSFDQLRYMMAVSNKFNSSNLEDQVMFIGGLGVLGNVVRHTGTRSFYDFRSVHDTDFVLRDRKYAYLAEFSFDELEDVEKSRSIGDKLTFKGYSVGNHSLEARGEFDVYVPSDDPRNGVVIDGTRVDNKTWEKMEKVRFFGVPVNVMDPLTLLSMKLNITSGFNGGGPREKDYLDSLNLMGVLEKDNKLPEDVRCTLTPKQLGALEKVSDYYFERDGDIGEGLVIPPTTKFMEGVFEDEDIAVDRHPLRL